MEQGQSHRAEATSKAPEIWAIRTRLQMALNGWELAMLNLAIDSKLERAVSSCRRSRLLEPPARTH